MTKSQKGEPRTPVRFQTAREGRLTPEEFTIAAIEQLRVEPYNGIHTRRSGFNERFREYYGEGSDPIAATEKLEEAGKIVIGGSRDRSGVMIYKAGEEPEHLRALKAQRKVAASGMTVGLEKILAGAKKK